MKIYSERHIGTYRRCSRRGKYEKSRRISFYICSAFFVFLLSFYRLLCFIFPFFNLPFTGNWKLFLPFFLPCPKLIPKILLKLIFPTIARLYSVYHAINKHFQNSSDIFHQINPPAIKVPYTYPVENANQKNTSFSFSFFFFYLLFQFCSKKRKFSDT